MKAPLPSIRVLQGILAACGPALMGYEAALGTGDVSTGDARKIKEAQAWAQEALEKKRDPKGKNP